MVNETIKELLEKLAIAESERLTTVSNIKSELQEVYNQIFEVNETIQEAITNLENFTQCDYSLESDGLYYYTELYIKDSDEIEEYLENYLHEFGYIYDSNYNVLKSYCGDDYIAIQDDTRHDNGVWQGYKLIIKESEYTICDDCKESNCSEHYGKAQIDESLRNKLIKAHMERTGYFPAVGRVTCNGDFIPVNTNKGTEND